MKEQASLFHAEMVNESGVNGQSFVKNGGLKVKVSSPLNSNEGTNPEELIGLSLSTCLNATIQSLLKARGKENTSRVEAHVDFMRESNGIGYFFNVNAFAKIDGLPFEESKKIIEEAELRCPVSKLLAGSKTVSVKAVKEF
ncbi:OsmC family protein [Carnobacterium pleistocenium]|uniref:OsmC family protein n=1 Tax=Carnobacterium pleistocenium TaxID=181073 RepID=UPI000557943E|nr:OsmC family protein [Carnobacterium pleistocenium]